jgi:hypothetical protein
MFWPLIGGFIAVILLTLLIGKLTDSSGQDTDQRHR